MAAALGKAAAAVGGSGSGGGGAAAVKLSPAVKRRLNVISTLRGILRAVSYSLDNEINPRPALFDAGASKQRWQRVVISKYKAAATEQDVTRQNRLQRMAEDYLTLLTSVSAHEQFLRDGGWGIRQKEEDRIGSTARRVGLGMPAQHPKLRPSAALHAQPTIVTPGSSFVSPSPHTPPPLL